MPHFKKSILRVGTHHSPDGPVRVTPKRLRHWARMHRSLRKNNQTVPVDWDHADDPTKAVPMSTGEFRRKRRSAKNTVGHLHDFRVSKDGQSAEITLDLHRKSAVEAAKKNSVFISPVIFEKWQDGGSNGYKDVITHVDFVNHPVDSSQSPFKSCKPNTIACAIRMGLDTGRPTIYRFAADEELEEEGLKKKKKKKKDSEIDEEYIDEDVITMDKDDDDLIDPDDIDSADSEEDSEDVSDDDLGLFEELPAEDEDEDESEAEGNGDDEQAMLDELFGEESDELDVEEDEVVEMSEEDSLDLGTQVLSDLEDAGIAPPDVDPTADTEKFLLQLCAALRQKKMDENPGDAGFGDADDYEIDPAEELTVTEPEFATMSLRLKKSERRANSLHAFAERQYRMSLQSDVKGLLESGRCNEREAKALVSALRRTRLSLNDSGKPKTNDISKWIKCRKILPEGACRPADRMLSMSLLTEAPEQLLMDDGPVDRKSAREYVDDMSARHPGMLGAG
jgi:hypothetical protein